MKCSLKILCFLCALGAPFVHCLALDREAFSITNYDLNVRLEPDQHRIGARGRITLRNDTSTAQKIVVLQISSSLDWRSITAGDQPVQFVSQPLTSDIDHTGSLSEAIVTLPEAVAPKSTVDLSIAYEGVILLDATRLTRIGAPDADAASSDWDQIGPKFTGVRGVGYVAWYPIATDVANLSESESLFETVGRWKSREAQATMHIQIASSHNDDAAGQRLLGDSRCRTQNSGESAVPHILGDCTYRPLGFAVPALIAASYLVLERAHANIHYLPGHETSAASYAEALEKAIPLVEEWFGPLHDKAETVDLPASGAAPFESGNLLLTPLASVDSKLAGVTAVHQLAHAAVLSRRPWVEEGLAHFAQALYLEQQKGRQAALDYMGLHRSAFTESELQATDDQHRALASTANEEFYRSKAMYVWWMLRDIVGEPQLKKALKSYRIEQDNDPKSLTALVQAESSRDLQWFFDDWVYHDRGLPDFKIESAFPRKTPAGTYLLTITVENLGAAGAEVPVNIKFRDGEMSRQVEVRGKSKAVFRVEVPSAPQEVVVNDGSVPESGMKNNVFKIEAPAQ